MSSTAAEPAAVPQPMRALKQANRVRIERAKIKREIAAGERSAASVVEEVPWVMESITLSELLTSQRRWGRTRTRKFLLSLGLPEGKQLGSLTSRQRKLLQTELEAKVPTAANAA